MFSFGFNNHTTSFNINYWNIKTILSIYFYILITNFIICLQMHTVERPPMVRPTSGAAAGGSPNQWRGRQWFAQPVERRSCWWCSFIPFSISRSSNRDPFSLRNPKSGWRISVRSRFRSVIFANWCCYTFGVACSHWWCFFPHLSTGKFKLSRWSGHYYLFI